MNNPAMNTVTEILASVMPGRAVLSMEPLEGGQRNTNLKLRVAGVPGALVLRLYRHEVSLCQKELDLMKWIRDAVPVPEVVYAQPDATPPFVLLRYVEGVTFRELRRVGDDSDVAEAAASVGEVLAAIHRHEFPLPGWVEPGPRVGEPLLEGAGADAGPRFIELCLGSESARARVGKELRARVRKAARRGAEDFAAMGQESRLVHGDFNKRNVIVEHAAGGWRVAAVLDWEFAIASTPLTDFGNFLRYEREGRPAVAPYIEQAYRRAGGSLPQEWRRLSQLVDLIALCELLSRGGLPDDMAREVVELMEATT
jgi:aminoglycoside phosphotransferase (APT) family kinase protein